MQLQMRCVAYIRLLKLILLIKLMLECKRLSDISDSQKSTSAKLKKTLAKSTKNIKSV
jgi:hypothetical protein